MKKKCKIIIDVTMTVLLLFLMARQLTGDEAHEWLGAVMFLLWILHHVLNIHWYAHLLRGKYTPYRIFHTIVNMALLLSMAGMMVSGIILSREVFAFLPIHGSVSFARSLHVFCAFWCFALMAFHLGLHWNMILRMAGKKAGAADTGKKRIMLRLLGIGIALYGAYALVKNQFLSYMFLQSGFVFFDFDRPVLLFAAEYLAIMGLFVCLAHYVGKGIRKLGDWKR